MVRKLVFLGLLVVMVLALAAPALAKRGGNSGDNGIAFGTVYVESQGLYYDTLTAANLPQHGPFQKIDPPTAERPFGVTSWGPGNPEFHGGRWWVDVNGNDAMDPEGVDHYFLCPLLGPGRATP
jgi:hypothetical protein